MTRDDAIDAIAVIHIEDGDILTLTGKHADRQLANQAVQILRQRGLERCVVLTARSEKALLVQMLDRDMMRDAGWVRIEEAGMAGVAGDFFDQYLMRPGEDDGATV